MFLVSLDGGPLQSTDAGGVHKIGGASIDGVAGFIAVQVMTGVERDQFLFGNPGSASAPGFVSELEQDADGSYSVDACIPEISGRKELAVHPDTRAAIAAGLAGRIKIAALAVILVVIVHHVPVVDDEFGHALDPDIDGAGSQRLRRPGFESLSVHAVRYAIVLPE